MPEAALRPLHTGIPASGAFLQHLTLVVGMLGAAVAARENRLLALSTLQTFLRGRPLAVVRWLAAVPTIAVGAMLCVAAWQFVQSESTAGSNLVPGLPLWWVQLILPIGFGVITLRTAWHAGQTWGARAVAVVAAACLLWLVLAAPLPRDAMVWTGLAGHRRSAGAGRAGVRRAGWRGAAAVLGTRICRWLRWRWTTIAWW